MLGQFRAVEIQARRRLLDSGVNLKRVAYHIGVVSDDGVRLRKRISDSQKRDKIGIVIREFY